MQPPDPDALLRRINDSAIRWTVPAGFDPLRADPVELAAYGLPPKPDAIAEPELFEFWVDLFSKPLTFASTDELRFALALPLARNVKSLAAAATRSRRESSYNWSGAYITPRNGLMFTQVLATWVVPRVEAPAGRPADAEYRSSTWIGLDGQREYQDSTLPQIGTGQFVNPAPGVGVPAPRPYIPWIQWYPDVPLTLEMEIEPGDRVICWLIVIGVRHVLFIIKNSRTGLFAWLALPSPTLARVSGATAEWVTERPTSLITGQIHDLPRFETVTFMRCYAVSARVPSWTGRLERLVGPTLIDMFDVLGPPNRRVTISKAARPSAPPELNRVVTRCLF